MPTVRYQIRNEYGLADPELYRAADKDDPEAVLEGVAMAGLVGVLRQLGDLAEFAAEIFHDLHEEVTTTAARGHGLMLRVQQLEAEFPSIEKAFLVQTSHSHFTYNDGTDWHAHLRMDQNLITQGDMPRFILDSYEECRGPPRLFMLDKFDGAGAGACLKRYSDPSFFKVEFSSSGMMEEEIQWEKKSRKIRKKASHWRSGETNESFLAPLINSNLQPESSDQVSAKVPTRRVKLKSRNLLDSDITNNRRSYMEHLLEVHPLEQKVLYETSIRHSPVIVKSFDSSGLTTEAHEAVIDTIADSTLVRETYPAQSPTRKEVTYIPANELENHKVKGAEMLGFIPKKKIVTEPKIKTDGYMSDKAENKGAPWLKVDEKKSFTDREFTPEGDFDADKSDGYRPENSPVVTLEVDEKRSLAYAELTPEGEYDEYKSDDVCSDLDNYMDALNTIESEIETDSESRVKSDSGFFNMGVHRIDSGTCEQEYNLPAQHSEPDSVGESIASREWNSMLEHPPPNSVVSGNLTDTQEPPEHVNGLYVPSNQDNFLKESPNETLDEFHGNSELIERVASIHLLPNGTCNAGKSDFDSIMSEIGEASSGSYVIDLISSPIHVCFHGSDEAQSVTPSPDDASGYAEDAHVSQQLDHKTEELSDFTNNSCNFNDESMPLSKKGDLSHEKKGIPDAIHSAESVEEHDSEVITGTFDISDHFSEAENENGFEKVSEHHIGEATFTSAANSGEQEKPVREAEGCLDGSVSPNIHELSPEIGPIVHPEVKASKISTNDMKSSCEAAGDFDSILPHTDSMEFNEPIIDSKILSDDLLLLPNIPGTINSAEDVEPVFSEDTVHIQGKPISDEVPVFSEDTEDIQGKTISDEVAIGHVEDPSVSTVQPGTLQDPTEADNKSYNENRFGSNPALFLPNGQCTMQPVVRNIVAGGEDTTAEGMEARETPLANIVLLELEPHESHEVNLPKLLTMFSEKVTFLDNMLLQLNSSTGDAGKSNILMPNIRPLELGGFSDTEKPQESCDADSAEHLPLYSANPVLSPDIQLQNGESGFMVNSDEEKPNKSHNAASMEHFPLGSANEIFPEGMQFQNKECGLMMTSYEDLKESSSADSTVHFLLDSTNEMFPDKMELQNKELGCTTDGFEPVSDTLGFPSGSIASDLNKESLQLGKPSEFNDSLDDYVIVEGDNNTQGCSSVYSVDSSGYDVQLQENYLPHDTVLDRPDIEADESSDLKNSAIQVQKESEPIFSARVSSSESSILSSDSKKLDGACCTIPSDSIINKETLTYSSENEDYGSKEGISLSDDFPVEPEISSEDGSDANVVSLHSEGVQFDASDTQFQRTWTRDENHTQSISKDIEDQPQKSEHCVVVLNSGTELLSIASSSQAVSETSLQEAAIAISTQDSLETSLQETAITTSSEAISGTSLKETSETCPDKPIFIASSIHDISETNLQETAITSPNQDFSEANSQQTAIARSRQAISEASLQETSEPLPGPPTSSFQSQNIDETPPLPPLPPIEWRMGKLRLGSLSSGGNNNQPQLITNPFMELTGNNKYPQGPVITAAMVQPGHTYTSLPVAENEQFQHESLISVDEVAQSSRLSELPPITDEESKHRSSKHRSLFLYEEIANSSSPFQVVSHIEDVKFPSGHGAPVPRLEDGTTQYPQLLQGEGQDRQQRRPPLGHLSSSLELERSRHEALSIAPNPMLPTNPFLVGSSSEEWKHQYSYGVHGGEKHLNLSAPVVARGPNLPPYSFLYPIGENPSTLYDFMIPTADGEKPKWRYCSIHRPRDPLIEAVAAHDKSTLRKVSELDRPSVRLKADERDSLLEQIKNKSFNLKPANAKKMNIKGVPPTNLKIAAILEKANAIRQACAGSDEEEEDDDGDSWSDS